MSNPATISPGRFAVLLSIIAVIAITLGIIGWPSHEPEGPAVRDVSARKVPPDFELKDANGKIVHLSDYKGKVVLLDFWATWCVPCGVEIPWFTGFEREYKDRGFEVLGVSLDENGWKDINPFAAAKKINYRVVLGNQKLADQYGLEAYPTTFVIDREGRIASVHVGLVDKKEFENAIQQLL